MTNPTTTAVAITTFVQPARADFGPADLLLAIVGDDDLRTMSPHFIGVNRFGDIEFVTTGPADGMAYAAALIAAGVARPCDTVIQRVGLGMLSAFAE